MREKLIMENAKSKKKQLYSREEQDLNMRIWKVKAAFMDASIKTYMPILQAHYPEYRDSDEAINNVHKVWNCQVLNEKITLQLENLVEIIKNS